MARGVSCPAPRVSSVTVTAGQRAQVRLVARAVLRVETTAIAALAGGDVDGAYVAAYDGYRMAAEALLARQARRSLSDPAEIAYYACYGPRRSSTADLAWAAGSRWHIEECLQQAKGEAGLDQYQVRTWRAWYAHITLSMLALAWPAASRAQAVKKGSAPATPA